MTTAEAGRITSGRAGAKRVKHWNSPWINGKFIAGSVLLGLVILLGLAGPLFWDKDLALVASSPTNLPPMWVQEGWSKQGVAEHPLGTESNGRDMLAVVIVGAPASLLVGFAAAGIGMLVGITLGSLAGYVGGRTDDVIRTLSDAWYIIPPLAVLIVLAAHVRVINLTTMAFVLAIFAWPGPTRMIRAQILTLRERGYVRMAVLSGMPSIKIIVSEMLPNMLPWLAASLTGAISGAILAAASLEALGLGPTRLPTLGMTIYHAINSSAIIRGMWWWWGIPILVLIVIFSALFLITVGLDEIANPRLRGATQQ
jgi:peptide/nickel transport system permease protein